MFTCAFLNCGTTLSDKNLSFYLFPFEDEEINQKWIDALGYPEEKPYIPHKDNFICSKHFMQEDIEDGILKPNAVPIKRATYKKHTKETSKQIEDLSEFDMCRICGKAKQMLMHDIFDVDYEICEKIGLCLPIVINPNDNLPQSICDECHEQLEVSAALIKKCWAGEEKFNMLFGQDKLPKKQKHTKVLPLQGPIVCDKCDVFFTDMSLFDEHMIEHEEASKPKTNVPEKPSIVCSTCGHIFPDWKMYESHKTLSSCSCNLCGDSFKSKCHSNNHKCQKYKCDFCGVIYKSELLLRKHTAKAHPNPKMVQKMEPEIDLEISDMPDIKPIISKKHLRNRKELYHCNICDIKFTSNKKLREHCIEYHGTPNVLWICKFCGKSMTTKVSLQIHERIHFDSKPYICEWCGNGYRSRANLNQHQVIHTGVRNHECPKCGKRFSRKAFVRTHMRVHTGERPYVCDICGHRFTQLGDMKRHRNRHQNPHVPAYPSDRVYACDFCGEQFTQLSMLKKHRIEHSSQQHHHPITIIEEEPDDNKDMRIEIEHVEDHMEIEEERVMRGRHRSE